MALSKIDVANMLTGIVPNDNSIRRPNAIPLIINGDMQVSQRSTSQTGKTSAGYYTCDRMHSNIDSIGTYTIIQESLSSGNAYINGFTKAWRIDTTTADASPASGDNFSFIYSFEGQDLQLFKKGTANAEKFTLAFWVKSNKTGTGNVNLFDTDNTRLIGGTYTISSADTWEHKVVNFAADTTGAFTNDNGQSLKIEWFLDSGTNFSSGTTDTTWGAKDDTDRNASGTLQIARNTDNDWAITGIQLEVGEYSSTTLPPFQHESFADNLARCQRYYNIFGNATGKVLGMASFYSTSAAYVGPLVYPVEMRSSPTLTITGGSGDGETTAGYAINHSASNDWFATFSSSDTTTKICILYVNSGVSAADGDAGRGKTGDSSGNVGKIESSAEL
jgi:hypothetical protein